MASPHHQIPQLGSATHLTPPLPHFLSQLTHDGHRHIAGIIKDTLGLSYDMPPSQELKKLVKVCVKWGKDIVEISKPGRV